VVSNCDEFKKNKTLFLTPATNDGVEISRLRQCLELRPPCSLPKQFPDMKN
jgi:hypothetical protein